MSCCGKSKSGTKRLPAVVTELPEPTEVTAWLWYTGEDYKSHISGVPTKAKYKPQGNKRAFHVFVKDVPYLTSLKDEGGERLFLGSVEFNRKDDKLEGATPIAVDYSSMKVAELRKELKNKGLPTDGKKAELLERLTNES